MRFLPNLRVWVVAASVLSPLPGGAQTDPTVKTVSTARQLTAHTGEMTMPLEAGDVDVDDALRFEPYQ